MTLRLLLGIMCVGALCSVPACGGDSESESPGATGGSAGTAPDSGTGGTAGSGGTGGAGGEAPDAASPDAQGGEAGAAGEGGGGPTWHEPACTSVQGTWAVTFTSDDGATVAPGEGVLGGVEYTYGLAALDTPDVLVAEHAARLLRSDDAGCTWTDIGPAPDTTTTLTPAKGGRVYGYRMNGDTLFRLDGTTVTSLVPPTTSIHGLGVDPSNGDHLVVGGEDGQIWESSDAGGSFQALGVPAPKGCFYDVAFDPNKPMQHIVCGTIEDGTFVTKDGAETWTPSDGDATYANTFSIAISPADPDVVWIEGFQLGWHNGQQIGPEGMRIWRSTDGGMTFSAVIVEEDTTANLFNGNLLAAHPSNPDLLFFTFGTPPIAGMSSESFLYRFDASTSTLTEHKQAGIDSYDALVFSPANPQIIYLGKTSERPGGP